MSQLSISNVPHRFSKRVLLVLLFPTGVLLLLMWGIYDGIGGGVETAYHSIVDLVSGVASDAKETWKQ